MLSLYVFPSCANGGYNNPFLLGWAFAFVCAVLIG